MFLLQAAVVKSGGGILTAVHHYERMFRAVGVRSAVLLGAPSDAALRAEGVDVLAAPELLVSPLGALLPLFGALRSAVEQRAQGEPIVALVHSDRTLLALTRMFPSARFVTPCHSDKFKHKKAADLVVTLNQAQHEFARAALPGVRCALLGNPYVSPPSPQLSEGGPPRVNFVARFTPTKDPLIVVDALARMQRAPQARFVGAGEMEARVKSAIAARSLAATFPGWISAPFADFHRNDILVSPSHWEGLPYLLQEALDHGVPIVASDIAGHRAALGDGAYGALFAPGNAAALAHALERALGDLDALRAKAEEGRAALRDRYTAAPFWDAMRTELEIDDHA